MSSQDRAERAFEVSVLMLGRTNLHADMVRAIESGRTEGFADMVAKMNYINERLIELEAIPGITL